MADNNEEFEHDDGFTYVRDTRARGVCQNGAVLVWVCRRAHTWNWDCRARVWTRAADGAFVQYGSGNLYSKHTCRSQVAQRLRAAEYWYDIFKFLPRRQLVRDVQPVCRWFNAIGNSIPNLHFIVNLNTFFDALARNGLEANRQLLILESGSEGQKAVSMRHIRLNELVNIGQYSRTEAQLRQHEKQRSLASLLRLAAQLFNDCSLIVNFAIPSIANTVLRPGTGHLALLQTVRVSRAFFLLPRNFTEMEHLLHHPAILNCPYLSFHLMSRTQNVVGTFQWLHHKPADTPRQTRIFIYRAPNMDGGMIQQCRRVFEEAQTPDDQRAFVLISRQRAGDQIALFRIDNPRTGEVLLLERHPISLAYHCLRRCLATELPTDGDAANRFYHHITQQFITMNDLRAERTPVLRICGLDLNV